MEDKYSDDQIGRARVKDTPELEAYYKELETLGAGALWTVANDIEPWEPRTSSVPMLWKYDDLRELVLKSSELVTPEQAGRRVVYLVNDKRKDVSAAVGWLYTGIQVTRPGAWSAPRSLPTRCARRTHSARCNRNRADSLHLLPARGRASRRTKKTKKPWRNSS